MCEQIDRLLLRNHRDEVLQREDLYLSMHSNVEVFEAGRKASKRRRMDDAVFTAYLKNEENLVPEEPLFRVIFVPDKLHHTDKLQLTPTALKLLLDRFHVCSRFAGMMHLQMTPSRKLQYDSEKKLIRVQYVYSHVIRSLDASTTHQDPTKRVLDWQRFVVWTGRDMITGATTMIVLRCPPDLQDRFIKLMGDEGEGQRQLIRQPMLPHAFFAEDLNIRQSYFNGDWARPIYEMESDLGRSAAQYTSRARKFMIMARQIGNVLTDYEIWITSLKSLQEISHLMRASHPPAWLSNDEWQGLSLDFDDVKYFEQIKEHTELQKTYGQLYKERCQLNYNECSALVNQREIEISKSMSAESTIIARSSHRDGQSLRIIQYLGLIFLPLSLCTSVFGMAFFDTSFDPANHSQSLFVVADTWWWFIALGVPFTILVAVITWASVWWSTKQVVERRKSDVTDLEKILSYEMMTPGHKDSNAEEIPPK